jgi:DNA mismatch repair protein MutS2
MNSHALNVLEFPRVLDVVAGRASSGLGAERVRTLRPTTDRTWIEREHSRVAAVRSIAASEQGWSTVAIPDAREAIARLAVRSAVLAGTDLLLLGTLLRSSRMMRAFIGSEKHSAVVRAVLENFRLALAEEQSVEGMITRAIDDDGNVRDEASPALRKVRRELRGTESDLVRLLERLMSKLESHQQVPDMSVTLRNGRLVIPIRREARTAIGGIVHDTSHSGATLFVEPPAAVEAGNRIRELEAEEAEEVERILAELTDSLRPHAAILGSALDALVELDTLYARVRYAGEFRCEPCELSSPSEGFAVFDGRHPLLLAQGVAVVPFDLTMDGYERTLLISGPNTGGKTVLLKSLGLFSALTQSGVPVPVGKGTRIAIFDDLFADIGDEQSIESSLSTFSAHVRNLSEVLRAASENSLVLIDELGSGTDPVEGAALGGAILENLTNRRTISIATTHLGALKELALEVPGVVNASLQFDSVALAPTYRLIKGIPGRSYGISIARRLALPDDVIARAEERLPEGERDVSALVASLEKRDEELKKAEKEAAVRSDDLSQRATRLAERERNVREREREFEKVARRDARQYLLDARADVEKAIAELQAKTDESESAAREARKRIEELAGTHAAALDELERPEPVVPSAQSAAGTLSEGDWVSVSTLGGKKGILLEIRDGSALVAVGSIKLTVPLASLGRAQADERSAEIRVPIRGELPELAPVREVDLRGMRANEIEDIVMQALDAAVRNDLKAIRIIHGKGTGALRERVNEMLKKESRVSNFRMGAWNEGGSGVTVVEFA